MVVPARPDVVHEHQQRQAGHHSADRGDQVERVQTEPGTIGVDAAGHTQQAAEMHREERQVQPDQHEPEVRFAQTFPESPAEHLGPPVVHPREQPEHRAAEQHVVEVRHHEVGIGLLEVGWGRRVHHP